MMDTARDTITRTPLPSHVQKCNACGPDGFVPGTNKNCPVCLGVGYMGVKTGPCDQPRGTPYRMLVYLKRNLHGLVMNCEGDA